jgi:acyl-CoA synthetase (AMP-forming)/AMP-acid ligase II
MQESLLGGVTERAHIAIHDASSGRAWTYAQLEIALTSWSEYLEHNGQLVFCFCDDNVGSLFVYLSCFETKTPIALLDSGLAQSLQSHLVGIYRPQFVIAPPKILVDEQMYARTGGEIEGLVVWRRRQHQPVRINAQLAVLLPTSGTTGSPKFVRLSRNNILANAKSIGLGLAIDDEERAILSLPLHYSYGLSVVNSHLLAGASVVVSDASVTSRAFWDVAKKYEVTSMAGVPYTYQVLRRLQLTKVAPPSLRTLTQAGGRLAPELVREFQELMVSREGRLFVMYGQTEATARIAIVPAERLHEKIGSAGLPIPGGSIMILDDSGNRVAPSREGHVVYEGPNVMMGYAENTEDLASGDVLKGRLHTGDLGFVDAEGYLFITGRASRFSKIFGLRVNLDDIERICGGVHAVAAIGSDDRVIVFAESAPQGSLLAMRTALAEKLRVHATAFDVRAIDRLPLLNSGKVDYKALQQFK